jgi:SAM-dependent methyltransferase
MEMVDTSPYFCHRQCPNCSGPNSTLKISSERPADFATFEDASKGWFGFFKEPVFFNFYRCADCGLLYNKKFFSNEALSKLYSELPDNTAGQDLTNLSRTQLGYFKFLIQETKPSGNYLELGPDIGLFTQLVSQLETIRHLCLFEPNRAVHSELSRAAGTKPFKIFSELFNFSEIPDNSIDVAVAIHVLDHLLEPKDLILELYKKLAPGGKLLFVTHNERSLLAKVLRKRWPAHCIQHPQLFNPKSTRVFLESCGFSQIKTRRSINFFTLGYLIKHLGWALGLGEISTPALFQFTLPSPLGNIMTIAEKPKTQKGVHHD